jgi:hypothetical protein
LVNTDFDTVTGLEPSLLQPLPANPNPWRDLALPGSPVASTAKLRVRGFILAQVYQGDSPIMNHFWVYLDKVD